MYLQKKIAIMLALLSANPLTAAQMTSAAKSPNPQQTLTAKSRVKIKETAIRNILYRLPLCNTDKTVIRYGLPNDIQKLIFSFLEKRWLHVTTLKGHTAWVYSVDLSPDGTQLATASLDKTARLWNFSTGFCERILNGHTRGLKTVTFSPDGKLVVTTSWDNTARLWNTTTGNLVHILRNDTDPVSSAGLSDASANFSDDGKHIVTKSDDETTQLWTTATGSPALKDPSETITFISKSTFFASLNGGLINPNLKFERYSEKESLTIKLSVPTMSENEEILRTEQAKTRGAVR